MIDALITVAKWMIGGALIWLAAYGIGAVVLVCVRTLVG